MQTIISNDGYYKGTELREKRFSAGGPFDYYLELRVSSVLSEELTTLVCHQG